MGGQQQDLSQQDPNQPQNPEQDPEQQGPEQQDPNAPKNPTGSEAQGQP